MSGKPLVPSKDALRTLRFLTYASPAALIGTAGTLCGVAAIHYNERQKVHRAERILETKRKLHSISQGRGSARLAHMFEAAERGDDFTINRNRARKPSHRRDHSVLAVPQESDNLTDWKTFEDSHSHVADVLDAEVEDESRDDLYKPEFTKFSPSSRSEHTQITHDIYENSNRFGKDTESLHPSAWGRIRYGRGTSVRRRLPLLSPNTDQFQDWVTSDSAGLVMVEQPLTDLHPVPGQVHTPLQQQERSRETQKFDASSILLELKMDRSASGNVFGSMQPWQANIENKDPEEQPLSESEQLELPDLYLDLSAEVPSFRTNHKYISRYDLNLERVKEGMKVVGDRRYAYVFASLMNFRETYGTQRTISLLERTMGQYIGTNKRSDFALAQALFLDSVRLFTTSELKPMIWRLVERFLQSDTPKLEVVCFLYPRCGAGIRTNEQHYYFLAHQYLEAIHEKGLELDQQVTELRKIVAGTQMCNIRPHEHLFVPTLRALCAASRMTSAQALFEEMKSVYKIEATTYSVRPLMQGHAQTGNWSKIKTILDEYHSHGFSEKKAYAVSGLLVSIIDSYALTHPPNRVIDFAVHCVREYNIQPVSELTRKIMVLCLRHRRYDLIVNWIRMVHTDYPHADIGSGSTTFAFDVSCVWREIDASCDDILNGCRAIASHAIRDPFSKLFRLAISEAVQQYLNPRLAQLREELGSDVPESPSGDVRAFHSSLKRLKEKPHTHIPGSRARLLLSYLLSQGEALRWINALCRGHLESTGIPTHSLSLHKPDWSSTHDQIQKLPPFVDTKNALMQYYSHGDKVGLQIHHDKLKATAANLRQQGRLAHAFDLIQAVYDSHWTQPPNGVEFDLDLFIEWLKLAWKLKSGSRLRSVLWAIVDASPQLQLSGQLLLLARIAAPKTHIQKVKRAKLNDIDELEYLRLRLKKRHWMAMAGTERLQFAEWKGFGNPSGPV